MNLNPRSEIHDSLGWIIQINDERFIGIRESESLNIRTLNKQSFYVRGMRMNESLTYASIHVAYQSWKCNLSHSDRYESGRDSYDFSKDSLTVTLLMTLWGEYQLTHELIHIYD